MGLAITGVIPDGALGKDLSAPAPEQPFGVRLDQAVVEDRFQEVWERPPGDGGALVVVEASDLARTLRYPADRG